jgi:hypothetical protein
MMDNPYVKNAYQKIQEKAIKELRRYANSLDAGSPDSGAAGCSCAHGGYFGGAEPEADPAKGLREYESSLAAKAKEDVIRRLAGALKSAGIDVDPYGDLDEIVRRLVQQIPNPKNGKTFSSEAKAQESVCRTIAKALNNEFSPGVTKHSEQFIDPSFSATEICRHVGEWAHSFASGVNTEFLAVHASVRNTLRTVELLDQIMRESYAKIQQQVEARGGPEMGRDVSPLNDVYQRAQMERMRQVGLLKNILNVTLAPAAKALELAMRDESEQNALLKRLKLRPGTAEFADSLASAISGLGSAASIAQRVNKALKQVGISVREYLDSSEYADFQRLLDRKIESGTVAAKDLAKFIDAIKVLRQAFDDRKEGRLLVELEEGGVVGGDDDEYKSNVDKRVEKLQAEKRLIINDFVLRMSRHYGEFLAAVKALGAELGRGVPITVKTDALRDAILRLSDGRAENIELAIIGIYSDAGSRERKERFVNELRLVATACANLMGLEAFSGASALVAGLKASIESIEKTIDYFSDVIAKKFGEGSGPGDSKDMVLEVAHGSYTLKMAISEFQYLYYIANMRVSLERSSKELEGFGEKYEKTLGDAVAIRLKRIGLTKQTVIDNLKPGAAAAGLTDEQIAKVKTMVNEEFDCKEKFYKALQAMDLYMKAFTAGIASNPDAVRDTSKILGGTQVIARWFSESTGEALWKTFENMGSYDYATNRAGVRAGSLAESVIANNEADPKGHYYTHVATAYNAAPNAPSFGIPQIGIPMDSPQLKTVKDTISTTVESYQALKNLVNVFARIGDTFNGRDVRSQIFMSPTQIFKCLTDYMKKSALSINYGAPPAAGVAPASIRLDMGRGAAGAFDAVGPYGVYFGSVIGAGVTSPNYAGTYVVEDRYFAATLKSMVAKILTTVGVYEMLERRTSNYSQLIPTRLIIGGGSGGSIEAIEGAADLYFRLPRLVEFYRGLVLWKGDDNAAQKVAMLPEIEGVFSGLIRLIFIRVVSPDTGDYSDNELRTMIGEINSIYTHYHSLNKGELTQAVVADLVKEINRRYGVILKEDMANYWKSFTKYNETSTFGKSGDTNLSLLPGEGLDEAVRLAPSDKIGDLSPYKPFELSEKGRARLDDETDTMRSLLREFRAKVDGKFKDNVLETDYRSISYSVRIKQAKNSIRTSSSPEEKIQIAMKLIQGVGVDNTEVKNTYMVYETAVVGLNALGAIHQIIGNFSSVATSANPTVLENEIMDVLYKYASEGTLLPNSVMGVAAGDLSKEVLLLMLPQSTSLKGAKYIISGKSTITVAGGVNVCAVSTSGNTPLEYEDLNNSPALRQRSGLVADINSGHIYVLAKHLDALVRAGGVNRLPANKKPSDYVSTLDGLDAIQTTIIKGYRYVARLLVNYQLMMKDLIEALFAVSSATGGLVEVRFPQGSTSMISIDFSKLQAVAESLVSDVKSYLNKLRSAIEPSLFKKLEGGPEIPGSLYWYEMNLIDVRFRASANKQDATVDGISRQSNTSFKNLIRETLVVTSENPPADYVAANTIALLQALIPLTPDAAGQAAFDAAGGAGAGVAAETARAERTRQATLSLKEAFGRVLSEIVFYDNFEVQSAQPSANLHYPDQNRSPTDPYPLNVLMRQTQDPASPSAKVTNVGMSSGPGGRYGVGAGPAAQDMRRTAIYNKGLDGWGSMLFAFNNILAGYLSTFVEGSNQKIYANLISGYANGIAAQSVNRPIGTAYPDLSRGLTFGQRGDPKPESVLLQSLAFILQRLVRDVQPRTLTSEHLVSTLTDIPIYMKETYRAHLPGYISLFNLTIKKCDFIRQLMQKTRINCARPAQEAALAPGGAATAYDTLTRDSPNFPKDSCLALYPFDDVRSSDTDMKQYLNRVLDSISNHAYSIVSCATEVLKELADRPMYMQVDENSIETYRLRNGKMPLTPLSSALYVLSDVTFKGRAYEAAGGAAVAVSYCPRKISSTNMAPMSSFGEPTFKIQYGLRGLINQSSGMTLSFDNMPGIKSALEQFNSDLSEGATIDPSTYLNFIKNVGSVLQFVVDMRYYKPVLSTAPADSIGVKTFVQRVTAAGTRKRAYDAGPTMPLFDTWMDAVQEVQDVANAAIKSDDKIIAYSVDASASMVVTVTESSDQSESINIVVHNSGSTNSDSSARQNEQVRSIIDMNIIPINVHALMRDVPLANLYNYEYTFDQILAKMYAQELSVITARPNASITKTSEMMVLMLIDPYRSMGTTYEDAVRTYGSDVMDLGSTGHIHRIFRGDNDLGLGRPKFLSDQIFNKALFGSVYQSKIDYDEAGPGVGAGVARGRAGVGARRRVLLITSDQLHGIAEHCKRIATSLLRFAAAPVKYTNAADYVGKRAYGDLKDALYDVDIPSLIFQFERVADSLNECQKLLGSLDLGSAQVASNLLKICLTTSSVAALLMPTGGAPIGNTTLAIEPSPMASFADAITVLRSADSDKTAAEAAAAGAVAANIRIAQGSKVSFALGVLSNTYSGIVQDDYLSVLSLAFYSDGVGGIAVPANRGVATATAIMKPFLAPAGGGGAADAGLALPVSFGRVFNNADGTVRDGVTLLLIKTMITDITQVLDGASNGTIRRADGYSPALIVVVNAGLVAIGNLMPTEWPLNSKSVALGRGAGAPNTVYNISNVPNDDLAGNVSRIEGAVNAIAADIAGDTTDTSWRLRGNNSLYVLNSEGANDSIEKIDLNPLRALENLETIGMMRFNTRFVRNLFFITNLTRILRLKLNQALTQDSGLVVNAHSALAAGVMEYGAYPFNPNEVNSSKYPDGSEKFEY